MRALATEQGKRKSSRTLRCSCRVQSMASMCAFLPMDRPDLVRRTRFKELLTTQVSCHAPFKNCSWLSNEWRRLAPIASCLNATWWSCTLTSSTTCSDYLKRMTSTERELNWSCEKTRPPDWSMWWMYRCIASSHWKMPTKCTSMEHCLAKQQRLRWTKTPPALTSSSLWSCTPQTWIQIRSPLPSYPLLTWQARRWSRSLTLRSLSSRKLEQSTRVWQRSKMSSLRFPQARQTNTCHTGTTSWLIWWEIQSEATPKHSCLLISHPQITIAKRVRRACSSAATSNKLKTK